VAQLIATAQKETGHYYLPTGEPCHGDLRQARKQKAYPSPTTIMGAVLARPGLDNWKQENAILQCMTTPRLDGETDADFARRVVAGSKGDLQAAADRGTYVHQLSEAAVNGTNPGNLQAGFEPHWESLKFWARFVQKVHKCEEVVVNHEEGYAGRVDLICEWGDKHEQTTEVVDFKTRKFKKIGKLIPDMPGYATHDEPHKVDSYDTDIIQLAAYAYAVFDEPVAARSVYIDPATGAIENKLWTPEEVEAAYDIFCKTLAIWRWMKKYDPREVAA